MSSRLGVVLRATSCRSLANLLQQAVKLDREIRSFLVQGDQSLTESGKWAESVRGFSRQIPRRREVKIVLGRFVGRYDAHEAFDRFGLKEGVGDLLDRLGGQIILRGALSEFAAGVDEHDIALAVLRFTLPQHDDD